MDRKATSLVLTLFLCAATAAHASSVPSVSNSTRPDHIELVGYSGSNPDSHGAATFVIRHLSNNPIPGALVVIDFSACTDLFISSAALDPSFTIDCASHTV